MSIEKLSMQENVERIDVKIYDYTGKNLILINREKHRCLDDEDQLLKKLQINKVRKVELV